MKTLHVSLMYTTMELGFKVCMPAHTNPCIICVSGRKDKSFIFVFSYYIIRDPLYESIRIFLPCHVILIITRTSIILAKAFS